MTDITNVALVKAIVTKEFLKRDFTGEKGDRGERGDKGEVGEVGPQGPQGIAGPQGNQGIPGERGPQGIPGEQGLKGPKGDRGERGPKGDRGPAGTDGKDGRDGSDGKDGVGVKALKINENSLLLTLTDGSVVNAGRLPKPEINQVVQGGAPGHFYVYSFKRDGNSLVLRCNNNKVFSVDISDLLPQDLQSILDRLTALESDVATLTTSSQQSAQRLDTLEANDSVQDSDIDALQAALLQVQTDLSNSVRNIRTTASADQPIPAGVLTILDFDSTEYTTGAGDFTVSADGRITVLNAGVYTISCGTTIEAQIGALDSYNLVLTRNGDIVAASGSYADLAVGSALALSASTQLSLSANDIVDARVELNQVVGGVGNGLVRRTRLLFGADATQVNHLAIARVG